MKIVSLSFFRDQASQYEIEACGENRGRFFSNFMPSLIRAWWAVWGSEWSLEIAHDDRVKELNSWPLLLELERRSLIRLRDFGVSQTLCGSMLERMHPIYQDGVEVVVCRDIDSLPMHRDKVMVEQFIASRGIVHSIHDSESHSGVMGGTLAVKAPAFRERIPREMFEQAKNAWDLRIHGSDQDFLNTVIYPKILDAWVVHSRRPMITRPHMRLYPVAPQVTELDKIVRHVGAGYDTAKCLEVLSRMEYPHKSEIEECASCI